MRIGEFAQKHDITQDAIRHYLDMGLLVAGKNGGQYKFSEADSRDLNRIIELKQLDFSLNEIQKILTFQRLSGTNTQSFRNLYLSFLEEKKQEINNEIIKYNKMHNYLNDKIHDIKAEELRQKLELGFPMTSLGILACPECQHSLDLSEGRIERNMIIEANIHCQCGYRAIIKDGIYIDETAVRTKMQKGKKMLTKEEFVESSSHTYINFLYKGMASLIEHIKCYGNQPKYIMELDNCVGFFLLQYIKYLPKNVIYILIDYDMERMLQLKKNLEMYYEHKNFIFLCCDYHRLPIVNSSVDIVVDYMMTKTYAEETGKFLLDKVLPLLKEEGLYTGAHSYYAANSIANLKLSPILRKYYNKDKMLEMLENSDLQAADILDIGPVIETNSEIDAAKGIELYQTVYAGNKRSKPYVKAKLII